jgi:hypothetical protein
MGNLFGKSEPVNEQSGRAQGRRGPTINISLLILHKNGDNAQQEKDAITDKLDEYPPPGSLNVREGRVSRIPDNNELPESVRSWVSGELRRGHVVLVCLSGCHVNINFGSPKVIVHPSSYIREKLDDVVAEIRAAGN